MSLDHILEFTNTNIQILGILIAIVGGFLVSKIFHFKVELGSLKERLITIDNEISFNTNKFNEISYSINSIDFDDFLSLIYKDVFNEDFDLDDYDYEFITSDEKLEILEYIYSVYRMGKDVFGDDFFKTDVKSILKDNNYREGTNEYLILKNYGQLVGKEKIRSSRSIFGHSNLSIDHSSFEFPNFKSIPEQQREASLRDTKDSIDELLEWKRIEKNTLKVQIKYLENNLKIRKELIFFSIITFLGIIIPQIVIIIHPLFYNYKYLKIPFAIYSVTTFIIGMVSMLIYIFYLASSSLTRE